MQTYAAIDLHSNNHYVVVEDEQERVLYRRRQPNARSLADCIRAAAPLQGDVVAPLPSLLGPSQG